VLAAPHPASLQNVDTYLVTEPVFKGASNSYEEKRTEFDVCSPPTYGQSASLIPPVREAAVNGSLSRRTMTLPQYNEMDQYMVSEFGLASPMVWRVRAGGSDHATADFEEMKGKAFSFAADGLCGCTCLVIISRRAVYFTHYWESISFAPDSEWLTKYGTEEDCFQKTVIQGLKTGVGTPTNPEQISLQNQAKLIDDEDIRAWLIIPSTNSEGDTNGYREKWDEIKKVVGDMLPRLKDNSRWTESTYDRIRQTDKRLKTTALGRVLIKYDPDHNGNKKVIMFLERDEVPLWDDEWT
jgi:hypothetical protein